MRHDFVELELDDLTYRFHYAYSPVRVATYFNPASGGVEPESVEALLPGGVTQRIDEYWKLDRMDQLVQMAYDQERERRAA